MSRSGTVRIGISGWDLWRLARELLSGWAAACRRAVLRQPAGRHDRDQTWPNAEDLTADFVYLRLHGSEELYASGYSDEALDHWAARIKLWSRGLEPNDARLVALDMQPLRRNARDVYVYFDND